MSDSESNPILKQEQTDQAWRRELEQKAPKALLNTIRWLEKRVLKGRKLEIPAKRELGQKLREVYQDQTQNGNARSAHAIAKIARYFDWSPSHIRKLIRLAETFSAEELKAILDRAPSWLSAQHLDLLGRVTDTARRRELTERLISEGLSAKTLAGIVEEEQPSEKDVDDNRGRPLAIPHSIGDLISQQERIIGECLKRRAVWDSPDCSMLTLCQQARDRGKLTPSELKRLKKLAHNWPIVEEVAHMKAAEVNEALRADGKSSGSHDLAGHQAEANGEDERQPPVRPQEKRGRGRPRKEKSDGQK